MSGLISRQAAIDALKAHEDYKGYLHGDFETVLEALPSVQPEQKTGKWKPHPTYRAWDVCSACGIGCKRREYGINPDGSEYVTEESYNFCPNCGAKMEAEVKE